jgi:hypothetical protein
MRAPAHKYYIQTIKVKHLVTNTNNSKFYIFMGNENKTKHFNSVLSSICLTSFEDKILVNTLLSTLYLLPMQQFIYVKRGKNKYFSLFPFSSMTLITVQVSTAR